MARPNKPLQPTAYNLSLRAVKVGGGGCAGSGAGPRSRANRGGQGFPLGGVLRWWQGPMTDV
jgi:hypothetical protein